MNSRQSRGYQFWVSNYCFFLYNHSKRTPFIVYLCYGTKHTKEGVLNEKLALKKLLTYMKSVYKIPQKIKCLTDERKRKSIPLFNIVMPVLLFLMLQYESFHTIFSDPESMSKRLKNCISGRIPKVDAVRDLLSRINPDEIRSIHEEMIDIIKRNRVFREGAIGG